MAIHSAQALLSEYEEKINEGFASVRRLISADAVFWFNDGSFHGIDQIERAFKKTKEALGDDKYWLTDKKWISDSVCIYRFNWSTIIDGVEKTGYGRGTTVFGKSDEGWLIVHEHLSSIPKGA